MNRICVRYQLRGVHFDNLVQAILDLPEQVRLIVSTSTFDKDVYIDKGLNTLQPPVS